MGYGKNLQMLLSEMGIPIVTVAKAAGIPASTLYSIIDRDPEDMKINTLKKIERGLNIIPGDAYYQILHSLPIENASRDRNFERYTYEQLDEQLHYSYYNLNRQGKWKVIEYARDLVLIHKYKKNDDE